MPVFQDIRELMAISPSFFLSSSGSESAGSVARIRGVGTTGDNPGLELAVGIFIDGVYRNRNNVGLTELGEVERIEVLRGPQGTLFGHNTLTFADNFELTAGLRYTKETKDLDASLLSNNRACTPSFATNVQQAVASGLIPAETAPTILGLACLPFFNPLNDGVYTGDREETEWSSTVSLAYNFGDDDLIFVSYAHGYKGGGFNLDRAALPNPLLGAIPSTADLEFEPEIVDSFEAGGKFGLFDQRATVNATLFYMDFEDFQLNTFNGIQFIVENLEEVTSRGA